MSGTIQEKDKIIEDLTLENQQLREDNALLRKKLQAVKEYIKKNKAEVKEQSATFYKQDIDVLIRERTAQIIAERKRRGETVADNDLHGPFREICELPDRDVEKPRLGSKTEELVYSRLIEAYGVDAITAQFKAAWCIGKRKLPFDFLLNLRDDCKILIEVDGEQHYMHVAGWNSPDTTQKRDIYKSTCANDNGYHIIRISRTFIVKDHVQWFPQLQKAVQEIADCVDGSVYNMFLSVDNEYDPYVQNYGSMCSERVMSPIG